MSIENGVALANENAGTIYHGRTLRRMFERGQGWDVRTAGGLATSGIANGGVCRYFGSATTGDFAVIQRGAGANMSVDALLGGGLVGGTESASQGMYFVYNDATANVVISASDPTNARIDVIGLQIRDKEYSGGTDDARLLVITGTPAGSPVVPTLPSNFLSLAHVAVAANAASIVTANITDKRVQTAGKGGIIICTSVTRPTVNLWPGMVIIETDTVTAGAPIVQVYDAALATWVPLGQYARAWSIVTDTLLGGDGPISFTSIPQTFTHLEILINLRDSTAATVVAINVRVNNDSGANYDQTLFDGGVATNVAAQTSGRWGIAPGTTATAGVAAAGRLFIPDYRSTTYRKNLLGTMGMADGTNPTYGYDVGNITWKNTAAITRVDPTIVNAKAGSRATLVAIR